MSFILDALKKSETDRQQQGSAEFANVPVSTDSERPPRWLWVLGALLLINIVVVAGLLMRPDARPHQQAAQPAQPVVAENEAIAPEEPAGSSSTQDGFAAEVAAAKQNAPARAPAESVDTAAEPVSTPAGTAPTINALALPTVHEVIADGSLVLPEMHVDIHVYSESAADRFVFINMAKHKEGSVLAEGPRVQRITPEGVVLSQNGVTFLLPRD